MLVAIALTLLQLGTNSSKSEIITMFIKQVELSKCYMAFKCVTQSNFELP
jgi:hypothetical protein